jgi:hypothetical protein
VPGYHTAIGVLTFNEACSWLGWDAESHAGDLPDLYANRTTGLAETQRGAAPVLHASIRLIDCLESTGNMDSPQSSIPRQSGP